MASDAFKRFDWTRYWTKLGEAPKLHEGYLVPPGGIGQWFGIEQPIKLVSLASMEDIPCLVLLGDLGLGKSVEIQRETERLEARCQEGVRQVMRVDLKRRSADLIKDEVFRDQKFTGWLEGRHDLTLLLDSMDECWRRVTDLAPLLIGNLKPYLAREGARPLHLRLSCRAAEWQDEIEAELRKSFGGKDPATNVQIWQLAPLTAENVSSAAASSGLDAERFMQQVGENEVSALAAHPITLNMLLEVAKQGSALGRNREEIYEAGCQLLCQDLHTPKGKVSALSTSAPARFEIAGYVAAAGVLSNRYLLFGSCEERPKEVGVIAGMDLMGPWIAGPGVKKDLDRTALAETLQTGLFETQPNKFHTWRHQSYGEYLAARHLRKRELPMEQYVALLCDTTSGRSKIWPQLEETACWLVALVPALFERLVPDNADVFLRCDPARLQSAQRQMLVIAYLAQVRRNEGRIPFWNERVRLNRLNYEGLAVDLESVIRNTKETWVVRGLALDIAEACESRGLTSAYFDLFTSQTEERRVRDAAGAALRDLADDEEKHRLKAIHKTILENDPDDEARGYMLQLLWPSHLTVEELLPLLTLPKRDNFSGAYKRFLSDVFEKIAVADLPVLLRWVATVAPNANHRHNDPYDGVCGRIALAAYQNLADIAVRKEFFELVIAATRRDGQLFDIEGRDLLAEEPLRQLFWREAVKRGLPLKHLSIDSSLTESGLIGAGDVRWLVEEVRATVGEARDKWLELTLWQYAPVHFPEQLPWMQPLVDEDAAVAKAVLFRTASCLSDGEDGGENWQKKHYYRDLQAKAERAKRPTVEALVDDWLAKYESGKVGFMWVLMEQLVKPVKEHGEEGYNSHGWGWNKITEKQRERIRSAGPGFLEGVQIDPSKNDGTKPDFRPYWAGIRMMLELAGIKSPWLASRNYAYWQAWAPLLFVYYDSAHRRDEEPWAALFGEAYRMAREEFCTAFERWLGARQSRYTPLKILDEVPVMDDTRLEQVILQVAVNAAGEEANDFDLFSFLLGRGSTKAETLLRTWRQSGHEKASLAEALLLNYRPERDGEEVLAHMQTDKDWGRKVLGFLNLGGSMRGDFIDKLPEENIARFWEWLDANFPKDPYFEDHDGLVTLDHEIYHLKNAVLHYLENCGKVDAVGALCGLVKRHPGQPWLGQVLAKAKYACRRKDWVPPPVSGVIDYLRVPTQKPLCSDADLCDALLASLGRYQEKLKQDNPTRELWNQPAGKLVTVWAPKEERPISDCLAQHLQTDLVAHGVVVVRESELRAKTGSAQGNEPDLVAYAPSAAEAGVTLKIPIEVKGAWNVDVVESVGTQLHDRYMLDARCGIHVTAYFTCDSWPDEDGRKCRSLSKETLGEALQQLRAERDRVVVTSGKRVEVVLLDARL